VRTTDSKHSHPVAPNILDQDFTTGAPNRVWVSDITYIPTDEGWLYLAATMDLFSRKVVGWSMSASMPATLVLDALEMAIDRRSPSPGLVQHSARGVQYAAHAFQALLDHNGIVCSMSRKGNCYDNAVQESFFHTLKTELCDHEHYRTRAEARASVFEFIEVFYSRQRLHSTLGYRFPDRVRGAAPSDVAIVDADTASDARTWSREESVRPRMGSTTRVDRDDGAS